MANTQNTESSDTRPNAIFSKNRRLPTRPKAASPQPRQPLNDQPSPKPNIDKPLPPIPRPDATASASLPTHPSATEARDQHESSSIPNTSFGSVLKSAKRYVLINRTRKRGAANGILPQDVEVAQEAPVYSLSYLNKATQTSPNIRPQVKPPTIKSIKKPSAVAIIPSQHHSRKVSVPGPQTPLWSPRTLLAGNGPEDYFSLPTVIDEQENSSSRPASEISSTGTQRHASIPDDDIPRLQMVRPGLDLAETRDSLGSYESRYSEEAAETEASLGRPAFTRKALSDSKVNEKPILIQSVALPNGPPLQYVALPSGSSKDTSSTGPMPFPFQRIPPFSGTSHKPRPKDSASTSTSKRPSPLFINLSNSRPSSAGSPSSLKRETSASNSNTESSASPPREPEPEYFQNPKDTSRIQDALAASVVPDHLRSSPLCPRNPKHKLGGTGLCPVHGQNGMTPDGSWDFDVIGQRKSTDHKFKREMEKGQVGGARGLELGMADHRSDDPKCPANMRVKGICLYHGRALTSTEEESVDNFGGS